MKELISRLTWVDYLAILAVVRGCYVGFRSGLFPEFLRIAAYLVTVVVTFRFHEVLTQYLTLKTFLNLASASAGAFVLLLGGTFLLTKLVTALVLKLLKVGEGGFLYRLVGMLFGACRWVILLSLLFMAIDTLPLEPLKTDIHHRSLTGSKLAQIAPMLFEFMSSLSPQLTLERDAP